MSPPKTGKKKKSTRISHLSFFSFFYQKNVRTTPLPFPLSLSLSLSLFLSRKEEEEEEEVLVGGESSLSL